MLDDPTHPLRQEFDGRLIQAKWKGEGQYRGPQLYKIFGFFCTPGCCPSQQFQYSVVVDSVMFRVHESFYVLFCFLRSRDVTSPRGINKGCLYCILYLCIFDGH